MYLTFSFFFRRVDSTSACFSLFDFNSDSNLLSLSFKLDSLASWEEMADVLALVDDDAIDFLS
jgi:hypothetical protein